MRIPRLRFGHICGLIALGAVTLAAWRALKDPSRDWTDAMARLVPLVLLSATLAAWKWPGPSRAFWQGFALFGWGWSITVVQPWFRQLDEGLSMTRRQVEFYLWMHKVHPIGDPIKPQVPLSVQYAAGLTSPIGPGPGNPRFTAEELGILTVPDDGEIIQVEGGGNLNYVVQGWRPSHGLHWYETPHYQRFRRLVSQFGILLVALGGGLLATGFEWCRRGDREVTRGER